MNRPSPVVMKRRRRFLREDVIAPWVVLLVIVGLWWAGARLVGESIPVLMTDAQREEPVADAPDPMPAIGARSPDRPEAASAEREPLVSESDIGDLMARRLTIPVRGVDPSRISSNFDDDRGSGRKHEALDILAPRGTPVLAVEDGKIARLYTSARGGLTIYQFDRAERFCYYYAHLDSYAAGLQQGQMVQRGQIIGYVGTTGNAPPNTPHLHFAIYRIQDPRKWSQGIPVDPAPVLRGN